VYSTNPRKGGYIELAIHGYKFFNIFIISETEMAMEINGNKLVN
jgi:hypothetical protein